MAILIAALGLLVALAALYFSAESLKKVDQKNEELIAIHVAELRKSIGEVKKAMTVFQKGFELNEKEIKGVKEDLKAIKELEKNIEAVHAEIVALDHNILPQARVRQNKAKSG